MPDIELANVGPIERLRIPVPANGGVVILRGRNGTGKSTALAAVDQITRNEKITASRRDGSSNGTIAMAGVTVRIGARATRSGELEVSEIGDEVAPHRIVDPGISDPERREAARVRALLRLLGATATPEDFQVLPKVRVSLPDTVDAVDLAAAARKELQAKAREQEAVAQRATTQAEAIRLLGVEPEECEPSAMVAQRMADTRAHVERLKARRKEWLAAGERATRAEAVLAAGAAAEQSLVGLMEASARHEERLDEAQAELLRATQLVGDCKAAVERGRAQLAAAQKAVEAAKTARADAGLLASLTPVTEEMIADATEDSQRAAADYERAINSERMAGNLGNYRSHRQEAESHRAAADQLREAATLAVEDVLTNLVAQQAPGWSVRDGRLCCATDRSGHEPFNDLSHAERWLKVLQVVASKVGQSGAMPILAVPQEVWEGMDSDTRSQLRVAATNRCVILTAEADDCDLRATVDLPTTGGDDEWS